MAKKKTIKIAKSKKTALVVGATGLVGKQVVERLLIHPAYAKIVVFGRKEMAFESPKLVEHIIDFEELEQHEKLFKGDDLFLCLGTTMKKAGTKRKFYQVDFVYNFNVAKIASANKVNQLFLVSSTGADEDSLLFYSRVKGALENAVQKLNFWSVHIARPSLLLGERAEKRFAERLATNLSRFLNFLPVELTEKFQPIEAATVAQALVTAAQKLDEGVHIYENDQLEKMTVSNFLK